MTAERPSLLYVATIGATARGFLKPYAAHFRELGWRVDVAASQTTGDAVLRDAFDHVYEIPLSRSIRDLAALVRGERALERLLAAPRSIVHVHTPIAGFVTRVAVRRTPRARRPAMIYTAHGFHFHRHGHPATNAAFLTAERLAGRWTDRLVVINDEDEAAARKHRIVRPDRLVRLPGIGIDTVAWSRSLVAERSIAAARAGLGLAADAPVFLVVGELNRNKRPGDVVAALGLMRHQEAAVVFAGDGPARDTLEAQVAASGHAGSIRFLGQVQDVRPWLASASALVLASRREGLPRSIMEAMAFEVPVVASDARGNRELIGDESVVPVGDVAALASAMDRVLDDPSGSLERGRRSRLRLESTYDIGNLLRRHEELYAAVLAERRLAGYGPELQSGDDSTGIPADRSPSGDGGSRSLAGGGPEPGARPELEHQDQP